MIETHKKRIENELLTHRMIGGSGCWEWTGSKHAFGYGLIVFGGKQYYVHRLSAFLWLDFHPKRGLLVCHHCDNPPCFNPEHLFIGTQRENLQDAFKKGRIHLPVFVGEKNIKAKLTTNDVVRMREVASSGLSLSVLGKTFGVGKSQVHRIVSAIQWKHIK